MKIFFTTIFVVLVSFFGFVNSAETEMTGGDFQIYADTFSFISAETMSGGDFTLSGTGGELSPTSTSGGTYVLNGGFQAAETGILSFSLSANSINFGTMDPVAVSSDNMQVTVSSDSENGYTVTITEDGDLRTSSGDNIDDVADGEVTAGKEEYGIYTTGADGLLSTDTAISGSVNVASATGQVTSRSTTVYFKVAVGASTVAGDYSHIITFTTTVTP